MFAFLALAPLTRFSKDHFELQAQTVFEQNHFFEGKRSESISFPCCLPLQIPNTGSSWLPRRIFFIEGGANKYFCFLTPLSKGEIKVILPESSVYSLDLSSTADFGASNLIPLVLGPLI